MLLDILRAYTSADPSWASTRLQAIALRLEAIASSYLSLIVETPPMTVRGVLDLFQTCYRCLCDKHGFWGGGPGGAGIITSVVDAGYVLNHGVFRGKMLTKGPSMSFNACSSS